MHHKSLCAAAAVSLLIGPVTVACSGRPPHTAAEASPPLPVTVATVTMTDVVETVETGGVVQARTTATITSRILATVAAVRVAPGDHVRSGQVLIVLDSRDLGARARSAQAGASGARQRAAAADAETRAAAASLALARATHDRIASLHAKRSATPQELDEATAGLRAAEARAAAAAARLQETAAAITSAEADSEAASTNESFTQITAPFDGVVTEKMVEPGNMAAPGMPLVRVEDARGFRLDVRVDESRVGTLRVGDTVPVSIDADRAIVPATMPGTVSEVARAVDSDARAFIVKITLPSGDGLRSGMFGRAHLSGATRRALTVPPEAVVRHGQVTSVFTVDNGVARLRMINAADREVLAGLSNGDTVIVGPSSDVIDGRRVVVGGRR